MVLDNNVQNVTATNEQSGFVDFARIPSESRTPTLTTPSLRNATFAGIVSQCPSMQHVFSMVERVSKTQSTVLVLGESGTGKELIAQAIHKLSGRAGRLVPVNCGAIPEEILESELFGHEKGSFTGAVANKTGRFQMADGGTIFLDEIGEMSPKLQVKLLRVLQERKVDPVGSTRSIDVDVRVIAATNKDLKQEVKEGRFREDLFYRLNVVPVELPPLRARGLQDVRLLASYFLERANASLGRVMRFAEATLDRMSKYAWPGNIRELENLVERLSILSPSSTIDEGLLPDYVQGDGSIRIERSYTQSAGELLPAAGIDFNAAVEGYENNLLSAALKRTNGNKMAAAKLLGLNRTTLVEKLKKRKGFTFVEAETAPLRPTFE
jgi:transcriptional regulator with GAF, ATPase, and Fis domain